MLQPGSPLDLQQAGAIWIDPLIHGFSSGLGYMDDGLSPTASNTIMDYPMSEPIEKRGMQLEKSRLEALTDGIFAFYMTLLVTSLILPRSATITQTSTEALLSLVPD